jgi:PIN domain nuclease of toxin-antitoxin system
MPERIYVADASAMIAYLRNEVGAQDVANILVDTKSQIFAHSMNLCEVYYDILRSSGNNVALEALKRLGNDGIQTRADMDEPFWLDIGRLKVNPGSLSLADCIGIALARREQCELLTADHHEMDALVGTGIVDLKFIR